MLFKSKWSFCPLSPLLSPQPPRASNPWGGGLGGGGGALPGNSNALYLLIIKELGMSFFLQTLKHPAYAKTDIVTKCKKYEEFYE